MLTKRAQQALKEAGKYARSLGHGYIGTGHLLYALACQKDTSSTNPVEITFLKDSSPSLTMRMRPQN